VLGFRESSNLAGAYGLAVTTTMVITTMIFFVVARERFRWATVWVVPLCAVFFVVDLAFFGATLFKIPDGGWFPVVAGVLVFTVLSTWRTGKLLVADRLVRSRPPLERFVASIARKPPVRAPGASAYLFRAPGVTPPALVATLRHHDSLHEQVLVISVMTEKRPHVHPVERCELRDLGLGFYDIRIHFGFLDDPDLPRELAARVVPHTGVDLDALSYFLGREALRVTPRAGMAQWRERLFALMSRNATNTADYFHLPVDQTIEIGVGVEL
jgi:KUP system potassium uptake protein